ncbi:MAG: YXWGXW repeat-containing protein [Terracidiphilus sp.]|jgi:hypothetical protein
MRIFRAMRAQSTRAMLLALLLCAIPASSWAGVFISVGFAPPVLPVYVQPPCPEPGLMWTPGYWAYGDGGYYWVPGTWVPAPYIGALWTPPYWGWSGGLFILHPGYWGPHVGYYGGVNYGFGYMGVGFAGGMWAGGAFRYNTAVMNVGPGIHNTYVDRTIVHNTTIVNNNHVAYSGGPGGINHQPTPQENAYSHEQHTAATSMQTQHENTAMHNTDNYASHNGGHPTNLAQERPAGGNGHEPNNNFSRNPGNETPTKTYNSSHSNTGNAPNNTGGEGSHNNTNTNNPPHNNTNNAPHNTGGGQQSHQPVPQPREAHQPPPKQNEHGHR